jgi:co-chaperonin GroES (HSP10)
MTHAVMIDCEPTDDLRIPKFRMQGDRLLVQPDKVGEMIGRIHLPKATQAARQKECATGRVVAMGPGMLCQDGSRWPMPDVKIGERILYYNHGAVPVKLEEGEYVSLRDDFILGGLEEGSYES